MILDVSQVGKSVVIISDIMSPTYVRTISYSILMFDKRKMNNTKSYGIYTVENVTVVQGVHTPLPPILLNKVRDYNTIVGAFHFSLLNSTTLNMDINIYANNISINNITHGCFQIMIMQTYYCP
jgi:hypothetical protein